MFNKYISFTAFVLFLFLGFSCEEIAPVINPPDGPGPDTTQQRQVLIEEFTGERCVNCPAGSDAINVLLDAHGERLVAVSIHAGFFAQPYPESDNDLANAEGSSILSLVGPPLGYPTAVVNRKHFSGEESRQVGQSTWPGYIAEELLEPPMIRINLDPSYNDATGQVDVDVEMIVAQAISFEDVRLTLYITENNIVDPQLTPEGTNYEYVHNHVFRSAITAFDGDLLSESLSPGAIINRSFSTQLDSSWQVEECHIVAFVSRGGGTLDVLQAHEVEIIE